MALNTRRVTLSLMGDTRDLKSKLNWVGSEKARLEKEGIDINVDADTAKASVDLDELRAKLKALSARSHDINIGADDKEAAVKLDQLRYKLLRLEHTVASPRISVTGAARALADLSAIDLALDRIDGREASAHADVSGAGKARFAGPSMMTGMMGAGIAGAVTQGLAMLPALGAAAGAGIMAALGAAVLAGTPEVKSAFSKMGRDSLASLRKSFAPMTPYLTGVASQVTGIVRGIGPQLSQLAKTVGPMLKPMVAGIGDAIKGFLPGLLTLMKSAQPAIQATAKLFANLGANIGKMLAAFAPAMGAASQIMLSFGNAISGLLPVIGEFAAWIAINLRDALVAVGPALADLISALVELLKPILLALKPVLSGLIAVVGLFADGLRVIASVLNKLPGPLRTVIVALPLLGAALWAVSANPIVLIAAAIVALVGAIAKYWPQITGAFKNLGKTLTDAFNSVKNFIINNFIHPVVAAFLNFAGWIIHTAASAFGWVPGLGGKLKDAAKAFDKFKNDVNKSLDKLGGKTIDVGVNFATAWAKSGGDFIGRGNISGRATGGPVRGPGTSTSDSIPALLSDDEFVVSASAHRYYGTSFFNALNAKKLAGGGVTLRTFFPSAGTISSSVGNAVLQLGSAWAKSFGSAMNAAGSGVQRWASLVLQVLAMLGQSSSWLGTVLRRINQESGGNPYAANLGDINARNGDPSRGLMQTIGATFAAYAGPFRGLGVYNPLANIYAGLNYALHRYGSLAALNRPGGYDRGGWLMPGYTLAYNGTGVPERVIAPGGRGSAVNNYVTVNVGATLASKQDIGRTVSDALQYFADHGGKLPAARR